MVVDCHRPSPSYFTFKNKIIFEFAAKLNKNQFYYIIQTVQMMKQLVPFDTFVNRLNDHSVIMLAYLQ
jgi:hypothetical protein